MRQVPRYLLIGGGRAAKHMQRYLDLLQLSYQTWTRKTNTPAELVSLSDSCSPILLLIKDSAIAAFIEQHPFLQGKKLVHFSGQLSVPGVFGAHPLTSFVHELYDLDTYQKIPFYLQENGPELAALLPGLPNPSYRIPDQERSYYHALCVMSGNFTALLWQKFFAEMEQRFNIPKEGTFPYLQQVMRNLITHPEQALTGPLVRGDQTTIDAHLHALAHDDFQKIYTAFVETYQKKQEMK